MNNKLCEMHNEPALFYEEDAWQSQIFLCRFCVQQKFQIKNINDVDNEEKQALKQLEMEFDQSIQLLKNFAQVLEQFTQQIQQKLKKFKLQVEESISHIIENKNQVKNITNDFTNFQYNKINEQKNVINNTQTQIISQLNNQIKELETNTELDQLYFLLNNSSIKEDYKLKQQDEIKEIRVIEKKFDYQLMQQSSYKQNERCYAITFNQDATIMIAGCDHLIKVFEFQNDKLKEIQQLSGHSKEITCLRFMKKLNQFISGSSDSTMIVWGLNQNNQWQYIQIMKNHTNQIFCIAINQNEDLLISGSHDKTIKFWQKQINAWSCNQQIDCLNYVYSISLSNYEDKLIAFVNKEILVIKLQGKFWMIQQYISFEQFGYRLCDINLNQFVFQPIYGQNLQIFDYDTQDQTYKKGQELQYQKKEIDDDCLFPIQYLSQIELIMVKNGNHVHLIKRNQNGQFTVEQSINFNTPILYGCITNGGRYIATWDCFSKEIQIRKFEF